MTEILHNVPDHGIKKTFVKNFQIHCSMWKHYFWAKLSYISWSRGNVYGCGLTDWKYEPGASINFFLKYFFYLESTICITFLLSVFLIFDKVIIFPLTSLKSELKLFIRNWYCSKSVLVKIFKFIAEFIFHRYLKMTAWLKEKNANCKLQK